MKIMKVTDAVGQVLCHDITQIIVGEKKGPVFRKGHIIREEDIPVLLSVGKENVYVWTYDENMLHENEAAEVLREICQGPGMHPTEVKEGLYIGTSTYVYVLPPSSKLKLKFVNISGTAKKVWLGVRLLRNPVKEERITVELIDTFKVAEPTGEITSAEIQALFA